MADLQKFCTTLRTRQEIHRHWDSNLNSSCLQTSAAFRLPITLCEPVQCAHSPLLLSFSHDSFQNVVPRTHTISTHRLRQAASLSLSLSLSLSASLHLCTAAQPGAALETVKACENTVKTCLLGPGARTRLNLPGSDDLVGCNKSKEGILWYRPCNTGCRRAVEVNVLEDKINWSWHKLESFHHGCRKIAELGIYQLPLA